MCNKNSVALRRFCGPHADFAARRSRAGRTFEKNVPEKFQKKLLFSTKKPFFNEILSRGRRFNVFGGKLTERCEEGKDFGKIFFEIIIFLIFIIFCGPSELRTSRMREVREYPLRHCKTLMGNVTQHNLTLMC